MGLCNSMKLSAMPGRATQDGWDIVESSEKNMVHWRREWQTTLVFLQWESHEQYKKAKGYDTKRWAPRLEGVQYTTGEEQRAIILQCQKEWSGWAKAEMTLNYVYVW